MAVDRLEGKVGNQANNTNGDNAKNNLACVHQGLTIGNHVTDTGRGTDQFGHNHIGPGPAQHQSQDFSNFRRGSGQNDTMYNALLRAPSV